MRQRLCRDVDGTLQALPPLQVVFHEDAWRSLSNRRLWCLKAYMGLRGLPTLPVRVEVLGDLPDNFARKNSTKDNLEAKATAHVQVDHAHRELAEVHRSAL